MYFIPISISTFFFFFFNDTATTEIYTLSLHDALPISWTAQVPSAGRMPSFESLALRCRSEEHTSELQSQSNLVCRLLLEKKKYIDEIMMRTQANAPGVRDPDVFLYDTVYSA